MERKGRRHCQGKRIRPEWAYARGNSGPGEPSHSYRKCAQARGLMMKPFPWKCGECRERAVLPATLELCETELEHDGRKYQVSMPNFQVAKCEKCGAIVLDDDANVRLSDALRREAGLLLPSEILQKRESLGLTQKALAGYLLIAEATLSRWETGAQIRQRAMDAFLRVYFQSEDARQILGLPDKQATNTESIVAHAPTGAAWTE
jgi:DNA-binding transcriptional regulator YiaG